MGRNKNPNFCFRGRKLRHGEATFICGVLNVTPDSFSDGGLHDTPDKAAARALQMLDAGADMIDVGGESTRLGAEEVPEDVETARVVPVIERIKKERPDSIISVDTRKSKVAIAAMQAGAEIINDVSGLTFSPDMASVAAGYGAGLVIMHMRGTPATMQDPENLRYKNLVEEVAAFLRGAAQKAIKAGLDKENIIIDPGIGLFSKNTEQNFELLGKIGRFKDEGYPVMAGPSRKSLIANALGRDDLESRRWGTAGAAVWLAMNKVDFLRVHDVEGIVQTLKIFELCQRNA